jgi:hypothetical protein
LFYGIDSYKVMKQAGQDVKTSSLFRGTVPIAIMGSGVSFGLYFVFYYPIRNACVSILGHGSDGVSVLIASALSAVPSSLVGVPADVLKKQLVLRDGSPTSGSGASQSRILRTAATIYRTSGVAGFFLGWKVNVMRDVPYAGLKMSLYEGLARSYVQYKHSTGSRDASAGTNSAGVAVNADKLTGAEAGAMGFLSGILTAVVTCPIDCVNTRIKSGELTSSSMIGAHMEIARKDGAAALFRGVVPRCVIIGFGSMVFWSLQASLLALL